MTSSVTPKWRLNAVRALLLASLSLGFYFLPGAHGMFPIPSPALISFPQQVRMFGEAQALWQYPNSDDPDCPILPILPEILVASGVTSVLGFFLRPERPTRFWLAAWFASSVLTHLFRGVILASPVVHQVLRTNQIWPFGALLLGLTVLFILIPERRPAAA
jgi:hypothetical protein